MFAEMHVYEVRPRKDRRGVDLTSDASARRYAGQSINAPQCRRNCRVRKGADYTNRTCTGNTLSRIRKRDRPCNHIGDHTKSNTHTGNRTDSTPRMRLASQRARPLLQELPVCLS